MRFVLSVIALLAVSCAGVNARAVDFHDDVNCYIKHLKTKNLLNLDFPEHGTSEHENCDEAVGSFVNATQKETIMEVRKGENMEQLEPCILRDLITYTEFKMQQKVYELSTTMTEGEKKNKTREAATNVERAELLIVQQCMMEKELATEFDGYFDKRNNTGKAEIYCKKKYVADHNLIDTKVFSFEINPNQTDFGDLDCDKMIRKAAEALEARTESDMRKDIEVSDDYVKCVKKVHREGRFFETTLVVDVLTQLELTEEQKEVERKRFVKVMAPIKFASIICSIPQHCLYSDQDTLLDETFLTCG